MSRPQPSFRLSVPRRAPRALPIARGAYDVALRLVQDGGEDGVGHRSRQARDHTDRAAGRGAERAGRAAGHRTERAGRPAGDRAERARRATRQRRERPLVAAPTAPVAVFVTPPTTVPTPPVAPGPALEPG